jgi:hypothetical protein
VTLNSPVFFALAATLAAYLFVIWYLAARRRHARRKAQVIASLRRKQGAAWSRLGNSAAGAP